MGYYNFQEDTPVNGAGNWAIQVYFDGYGNGRIEDDNGSQIVSFTYPWRKWFELEHIIDLDNNSISIRLISKTEDKIIYSSDFLSDSKHLGGVNFFAIPDENDGDNKNTYYIDDVVFEKKLPIEDVFYSR